RAIADPFPVSSLERSQRHRSGGCWRKRFGGKPSREVPGCGRPRLDGSVAPSFPPTAMTPSGVSACRRMEEGVMRRAKRRRASSDTYGFERRDHVSKLHTSLLAGVAVLALAFAATAFGDDNNNGATSQSNSSSATNSGSNTSTDTSTLTQT